MNAAYERPFRRPSFKLARSAAEVLECFYDILSPDIPIAMSDLSVITAANMGDLTVRVTLFNGHGLLDIGVERFRAQFDGLQRKADVEVAKNVIRSSELALENALPGTEFKSATIKTSTWSACEDGDEIVNNLLDKQDNDKRTFPLKVFGAEKSQNIISKRLINETDKWIVNIVIEPSAIEGYQLFFQCDGSYAESGKFKSFDERIYHFEEIHGKLLSSIGFESNTEGILAGDGT